jgi:hypothetical protein
VLERHVQHRRAGGPPRQAEQQARAPPPVGVAQANLAMEQPRRRAAADAEPARRLVQGRRPRRPGGQARAQRGQPRMPRHRQLRRPAVAVALRALLASALRGAAGAAKGAGGGH